MQNITLPKNVIELIDLLWANGHRADIVGGSVRDYLLGTEPHDFDITTDAPPTQIKEVFRDYRTLDIGIRHGTVTVISDGAPVEITTYRIDGGYLDNRHPSDVTFSKDLREDLARRDFTVNAICYSPRFGFTDNFGGIEDIKAKTIRAVGDPIKRFNEDALRILRGIRFASQLDFTVEENTKSAMFTERALLKNISMERINTEWQKLLSGKAPLETVSEYLDIIRVFIPEIREDFMPSDRDLFMALDPHLREIAVFRNNSAQEYRMLKGRLKSDRHSLDFGAAVISHLSGDYITDTDILYLMRDIGKDAALSLFKIKSIDDKKYSLYPDRIEALISAGKIYQISSLALSGTDLISLGYKGREIGIALDGLLCAVIEDRVVNDPVALVSYLNTKK